MCIRDRDSKVDTLKVNYHYAKEKIKRMEAKKFYTLEEIEDKYIGEKGTPKRDADVYKRQVLNRALTTIEDSYPLPSDQILTNSIWGRTSPWRGFSI